MGEPITFARALRVIPRANNERTRKSRDTEESAASIFATRDWLDPIRFTNSTCERRFSVRSSFSLVPNATLSST